MKIESLSRHVVQPLRPAPAGTKIILSNNDQVMGRVYASMAYYFSPKEGAKDFMSTEVLKASLAEALSLFYPLTGRFRAGGNGALEILCTNEGVELLEAFLTGDFDKDFAGFQPNPAIDLLLSSVDNANLPPIDETELCKTQHCEKVAGPELRSHASFTLRFCGSLAVSRFECGRVCLAVAVHHVVCDGAGISNFVQTWANIAGGRGVSTPPYLDRSAMKARDPPRPSFEHLEYTHVPPSMPSNPSSMTARRFEFSPARIQSLKEEAGSSTHGIPFTSFEVLAGHVWKCVTRAREMKESQDVKLGCSVDGRSRFNPPLPDTYFGNVTFTGLALSTAGELVSKPLSHAAALVHEAVVRVKDEYMRSALDWVEQQSSPLAIFHTFVSFAGPHLALTSWRNFHAYDLDFGWGTPEFFGAAMSAWDGLVLFLPSHRGPKAVDVFVGLVDQHMANLHADPHFYPSSLS